MYETGGYPPSEVGDVMMLVGYIEQIGMELDWDMSEVQLTLVISDLVSTGEVDIGGGMWYVIYSGGTLAVIADPYDDPGHTDPSYGINPPNATSPSTFMDGEVYLVGQFTSFYMTYMPTLHVGNFEGYLNWTGGTQLDALYTDPTGYTVAGTVDPLGAPVPEGYDLEADGHITFDAAIPREDSTWGRVKNLYR
jgi:hypothetical protein